MLISYQDQVYQVYAVCMFTECVCGFVIMGTDCISLSFRFFFTQFAARTTRLDPLAKVTGFSCSSLSLRSPFLFLPSLPSLSSFPLFLLSLSLSSPSLFLPSFSVTECPGGVDDPCGGQGTCEVCFPWCTCAARVKRERGGGEGTSKIETR